MFLIATAVGIWYFNKNSNKNYLITGLVNLVGAHVGSLSFASIIVSIVSFLKSAASSNNNQDQNGCAVVVQVLVRCCLSFVEELLQVLNSNAVIVMSYSGEEFIDSAKSAIYLIYEKFDLFVSVEFVGSIVSMSAFFITIIVPTGLGYLLLKLTYNQSPSE